MSITEVPTEGADHGPNGLTSPDNTEPPNRQERRRQVRKRRRGGRVAAAGVVVAVATAAGVYVLADPFSPRAETTTIDSGVATGLGQVTRGDLSERTSQSGTLSYAGDYKVVNRSDGTYTKLPNVGDVIRQGKVLYRTDGVPVIFLRGAYVPVYRELSWGDEGVDVRQLNAALVALGYTTKSKLDPKSDYFGRQTYYALKRLQNAVGLEDTGTLPLGQAIFLPANEIRVTSVSGVQGASASPNQTVLAGTSTERQVSVDLRATQQSTVAVGDDVTISLPNGKTTPGKVTAVGKVATEDSDGNVTVEVLIKPTKPKETGQLDRAPVQVLIESETVEDVLSVPVNALLALAGGGLAVEVVDAAGARRLVPVETGLFDDSAGRVQVTGEGLAAGQNVVVPAS